MDKSPKSVLERFYEAEAIYMKARQIHDNADFAPMRATLSPEVILHQSPDLPFGGEYKGHDGYERCAVAMSGLFDRLDVTEQQFFEQGDTVLVTCRFLTRSRINGQTQDSPMVQVIRVIDGMIAHFGPFYWNVPAYVAAGLPASKWVPLNRGLGGPDDRDDSQIFGGEITGFRPINSTRCMPFVRRKTIPSRAAETISREDAGSIKNE